MIVDNLSYFFGIMSNVHEINFVKKGKMIFFDFRSRQKINKILLYYIQCLVNNGCKDGFRVVLFKQITIYSVKLER